MSRLHLILCVLAVALTTRAPAQFNPGPARYKDSFACSTDGGTLTIFSGGLDSVYHLPNLCASSNDFELRFSSYGMSYPEELLIISCNKGRWWATLYEAGFGQDGLYLDSAKNAAAGYVRVAHPVPPEGFADFWKALRAQRVLEQPQPYRAKGPFKMPVCGSAWLISFKVGSKFGSYRIGNTRFMADHYPNEPAFRQQDSIVQLFRALMATTYPSNTAGTPGATGYH